MRNLDILIREKNKHFAYFILFHMHNHPMRQSLLFYFTYEKMRLKERKGFI